MAEPKTDIVLVEPPSYLLGGTRLGAALDPRRVSVLLSCCDSGYPQPLHDALNEIRQKDLVIQSVLGTREGAISSLERSVVPQAAIDPALADFAQEVAAYAGKVVEKIDGLSRGIKHLIDGIYKGFSVCQFVWAKEGSSVVPVQMLTVEGRRFVWNKSRELCYTKDVGDIEGTPIKKWPYNVICHQPRINGDEARREGLGRLLVWYGVFRSWAIRDWMVFSEIYGKPLREVIYDIEKVQEEDRKTAEQILQKLYSNMGVTHSNAFEVKVAWPQANSGLASTNPSQTILKHFEEEIALAVLGQKMTTGSVQGGLGGSGDTREFVRKDIAKNDVDELQETLTEKLIWPIVFFKFGERAKEVCPKFVLSPENKEDREKSLSGLEKATKLGAKIPMTYLHSVTGYPQAKDGEPVIGGDDSTDNTDSPPSPQGAPDAPDAPDAEDSTQDDNETAN